MGLDIARSLAKYGIPVYGLDSDRAVPGKYSTCCRFVQSPNPMAGRETQYLEFLIGFGRTLKRKAVLFLLSDLHVLLGSRHRERLHEYYEFVMPEHETLARLTTKDGLQSIAYEFGIPAPVTTFLTDPSQIDAIADRSTYPVILKPTESTYWHMCNPPVLLSPTLLGGRAKVVLCRSASELRKAYRTLAALDDRLVVQEVIPGEDSRLAYISFYLDRQSRVLGNFAGRKIRVIPTGFGSASFVRSMYDPELIEIGLKLLKKARYQGLVGIEFKKDPRDECYKLIEVNTRFGMWDGLSVRCGVDLPYIAYRDALGLPVEPQLTYREGVAWIDWQRDVRAAIEYWRSGQLSPKQWLSSLRGERMWAIYTLADWKPGVAFTLGLVRKLWNRLLSTHVHNTLTSQGLRP